MNTLSRKIADDDEELKDRIKHGGRVFVPMLQMDSVLQDGQFMRTGMSFRDHATLDAGAAFARHATLKFMNDAAYAQSKADINAWRGATAVTDSAPADITAARALNDTAYVKSVDDLNAWRH